MGNPNSNKAAHSPNPLSARADAWLAAHSSFNVRGQLIYDLNLARHEALADRDAAEGQRDALRAQRDELARDNDWLRAGCDEALAELKLWRMLVCEGGAPRYSVTPGAALNTIVTSTDKMIRRMEAAKAARAALAKVTP